MQVEQTTLPGVAILTPARHGDNRGFFSESWNKKRMINAGFTTEFVQDNHSMSETAGTLRGLHFQAPPWGQAKLVRCGRGSLLDVAVDVRRGSPTYGQSIAIELSFENGKQLMIPEGFLHGFVTLEPMTEIVYKCSNYYNGEADGSVAWDSCGINWGLTDPVLSAKDTGATPLAGFDTPFVWAQS
jgi:dTDP-4-dehydrorhamnose 3,5-epimerase